MVKLQRSCNHGIKKDGKCKRKPGPKRSGKKALKRSGKKAPKRSVKKAPKRSKNCKYNIRKDGKCKRKPGPKRIRSKKINKFSMRSSELWDDSPYSEDIWDMSGYDDISTWDLDKTEWKGDFKHKKKEYDTLCKFVNNKLCNFENKTIEYKAKLIEIKVNLEAAIDYLVTYRKKNGIYNNLLSFEDLLKQLPAVCSKHMDYVIQKSKEMRDIDIGIKILINEVDRVGYDRKQKDEIPEKYNKFTGLQTPTTLIRGFSGLSQNESLVDNLGIAYDGRRESSGEYKPKKKPSLLKKKKIFNKENTRGMVGKQLASGDWVYFLPLK